MTEITLFPQPQNIERKPGAFNINAHTRVFSADATIGETLADYLRPATGFGLPTHPLDDDIISEVQNAILLLPGDADAAAEAYTLDASPERVELSAAARPGLLHGMQTLRQLLPPQILSSEPQAGIDWTIPCLSISDAPAFAWRGIHLDVGRHFFPVAFIKKTH